MSTYTQYTGTFTKKDGTSRTMSFIKVSDLPKSMQSEGKSRSANVNGSNTEVVYEDYLNQKILIFHLTSRNKCVIITLQ